MKTMKPNKWLILVMALILVLGALNVSAAPIPDPDPALMSVLADKDATLLQLHVTSFKGERLEPISLIVNEPVERYRFEYTIDIDSTSRTLKDIYISPVPYSPDAQCYVAEGTNPTAEDYRLAEFGVPLKYTTLEGNNPYKIKIVSKDGTNSNVYSLNIKSYNMWDILIPTVIEEGKLIRIVDEGGFPSNEDMYLFINTPAKKALLIDAGMGGYTYKDEYREPDLYGLVRSYLTDDTELSILITHAHGDHYGLIGQFLGGEIPSMKVYWPMKEFNSAFLRSEAIYPYIDRFVPYEDGMVLDPLGEGGRKFEVFEVPGHTTGSNVLLTDDNVYAVTGDSISSGSYVFNFGANKGSVQTFNTALRKLEKALDDRGADGIHLLTGHSWQEPVPMRGAAGRQLIRDMRIASDLLLSGKMVGQVWTRGGGKNVTLLSKLYYGFAGYWHNGWDIFTPDSDLEFIQAWSERQKVDLLSPNFSSYNKTYQVTTLPDEDSLRLMAIGYTKETELTVRGEGINKVLTSREPIEVPLKEGIVNTFEIIGKADGKESVYTVQVRRGEQVELPPMPLSPATIPNADKDARLISIEVGAYKGSLEPYTMKVEDVDYLTSAREFQMNVAQIDFAYLKPITLNVAATYTINGVPCDFNIPYKAPIVEGDNEFKIEVTSADGGTKEVYSLTLTKQDQSAVYTTEVIEEGKVWRIQDFGGVITNEDMYLFKGPKGAVLFDTGMGKGDLRAVVDELIDDPSLPLTVVITHAGGDHHGQNEQFSDCTIYYPAKDYPRLPTSYDLTNYKLIKDGDILDLLGDRTFEAVEVIGHTAGGMVYLDSLKKYVVTGDEVSSGSYIFNFGAGRGSVEIFHRDMVKLEDRMSDFEDVMLLTGHSWQEPVPLKGEAGKQLITDMRIAAEQVLSGEAKGRLNSRISGGKVQPLRQYTYRMAGYWYNGWDIRTHKAALIGLQVYSKMDNRDLLKPGFSSYLTEYNGTSLPAETSVFVTCQPAFNDAVMLYINGQPAQFNEPFEVELAQGETLISIQVTGSDTSVRTYTVLLTRPEE